MTNAKQDDWGTDGWENQNDPAPFCKIGDGEGDVAEVRGLLYRISADSYENPLFHLQLQDGSSVKVQTCAALSSQLKPDSMGELVVIKFLGWQTPKKGGKPYKGIEVIIFKADALPAVLAAAFPRWRKIAKPAVTAKVKNSGTAGPASFADVPAALGAEDDDLPF